VRAGRRSVRPFFDNTPTILDTYTTVKVKESRTVQLKLLSSPEKEFEETVSAYLGALNSVSQWVHKKKITNPLRLHDELYTKVRKKFKLKSQMTQSCFRQVSASYRSAKKNRYKWDKPLSFKKEAVVLNYPRDFKFNSDDSLSLNTLAGRKKVRFVCGQHQRNYLDNGWTRRSGRLVKRRDGWYFHVVVTKEFEVAEMDDRETVIGADLGINNIAVASTSTDKIRFFKGGETKNKKRQYERVTASLQSRKGTRSSRKVLGRLSGRETRFMADVNHCVSKGLIRWAAGFEKPVIALEDLTNIRRQLGVKDGTSSKAQRKGINRWSYFQLRIFIEYKAHELGIPVIYVNPAWTSRHCPRCGHTESGNRNGRRFECLACRYQNNADVVASINIRSKATSSRYILEEAGSPSMTPEVPSVDAEALRGTEVEGRDKPLP